MDRADLISVELAYHGLSTGGAEERRFHHSTLRNGKKFVATVLDHTIRFIPGHYALSPNQIDILDQRQALSSQ